VERAELLALMDLNWMEMVREISRFTPGGWVVESEGLVMCGSPRGTIVANMAMIAGRVAAATVRAETERCFRGTGLPFSVMTRDHADAGLQLELAQQGYREVELLTTPAMAFVAGDGTPPPLPAGIDIRCVRDDAGREDYARVMAEAYGVYGAPKASILSHFALLESVVGPTKHAFLAYKNDVAVAGAILYLSHGVGGVGWVGTVPGEFGRGYGSAVTWKVVTEGLARGARFMNLQASPMGAPVYRRMGFTTPTHYRAFLPVD
jgi:acetyltransferase (GNAT) family protein